MEIILTIMAISAFIVLAYGIYCMFVIEQESKEELKQEFNNRKV